MLKIGSHIRMSGDDMFLGSVKEAISYNATAFMIYTGAPQNTIRKSIDKLNIAEGTKLLEENNISINDVVVHAPYIVNLANPNPDNREFAVNFLTEEIKRVAAIGAKQMVLHPGNAVGLDREMAINWIAEGINKIVENTSNLDVKIALETMAGKGNEVGKTFEELKQIIDLVKDKNRVSVCFDTCHTFDAGYDIKNDFKNVMKKFDEIVGKEMISVFHINDSKNVMGSHKDRHANIGFGEIGFMGLINVIYDEDFINIPKILETPYVGENAPYKLELVMIRSKMFDEKLLEKLLNT